MSADWQTWAALAIVVVTAAILAYRVLLKRKTGCGSDCGCGSLKSKASLLGKSDSGEPRKTSV
jgi:hypothetical protein